MKLMVVGTVAYDSVTTPEGERAGILGGSASYCAMAASYFTEPGILAVVGEDFREGDRSLLAGHNIDLSNLSTVPGERCFHWKGHYGEDLNEAKTLQTDLNVLSLFDPVLPPEDRDAPFLFLANIDPKVQLAVLDQVRSPKVVAADTMNYWIDTRREELLAVLPRIHFLIINEAEAKQLSGEGSLLGSAKTLLEWGPRALIVKRGEYGAMLFSGDSFFAVPAFPVEKVVDPTGAGDTFAGGFMGFLARTGSTGLDTLRQAIVMGSVMASFDVEAFSLEGISTLDHAAILARFRAFHEATSFKELNLV